MWYTLVLSTESFSSMVAIWGEMYPKPVLIWYHWWGQGCTSQPGSKEIKKENDFSLFFFFFFYKNQTHQEQRKNLRPTDIHILILNVLAILNDGTSTVNKLYVVLHHCCPMSSISAFFHGPHWLHPLPETSNVFSKLSVTVGTLCAYMCSWKTSFKYNSYMR